MTNAEAYNEALRRWPQTDDSIGFANFLSGRMGGKQYVVGITTIGFWIRGEGTSWEEAFADADAKEKKP